MTASRPCERPCGGGCEADRSRRQSLSTFDRFKRTAADRTEDEPSQGGPIVLAALLEVILGMVFEIAGDLVWSSRRDELDNRGFTRCER
jgi:hypothetical protein